MIQYYDGRDARVGDRVDYDGVPSTVEAILDTPQEYAEWGVSKRGLMFKNTVFGLVFEAAGSTTWDAVVFLARHADAGEDSDQSN